MPIFGDDDSVESLDPTPFQATDLISDGSHRLVLTGEVDVYAAPDLENMVRRICAIGPTEIVIDLREVSFMDSSGLRAMMSAHKLCKRNGCELSIVPGAQQVQSLFDLTGLAELLPFQPSGEHDLPPRSGILPKLFAPSEGSDLRGERS
jgi:anti-anti-sigma factor